MKKDSSAAPDSVSDIDRSLSTKPVTMKDVAALAGVNRASVSVVLNGAKSNLRVSRATRQRIEEAANQLGYRRNGMAAAVRSGNFGSVALLLSSHSHASTLPVRVFEGIHRTLESRGVHLIVHQLPVATLADPIRLPKVLTEWMCDGLMVDMTHSIPPYMAEAIGKANLPSVWLNVPREYDAVRPNDYEAGRQAVRHLLDKGHRRICYLDLSRNWDEIQARSLEATEHYSAHDRYAGVRDEIETAGAELILRLRREDVGKGASSDRFIKYYRDIKEVLLERKPTAIISYDDVGYVTPIVARDLGLKIPEDLSLIGFGSAPKWVFEHSITLMATPEFEMGQRMAQMLLQKVEQPTVSFPTDVIPFDFEPGSTYGPVSS